MKPVLECLGNRADAGGFHPVEEKVKAIQEASAPKNPTELKSFLGMLNFYGKFIPNLSSILEPLHSLLRKDVVWKWEVEQQEAFDKAENQLQSSDVLVRIHWFRERAGGTLWCITLRFWRSSIPCYPDILIYWKCTKNNKICKLTKGCWPLFCICSSVTVLKKYPIQSSARIHLKGRSLWTAVLKEGGFGDRFTGFVWTEGQFIKKYAILSIFGLQNHTIIFFIIHSKYFPDSDWLKAHV